MWCSNAVPVIETTPATVSGLIAAGDVRGAWWQAIAMVINGPTMPATINARILLCSDENEIHRRRYGLTRRRSGYRRRRIRCYAESQVRRAPAVERDAHRRSEQCVGQQRIGAIVQRRHETPVVPARMRVVRRHAQAGII